ncbi:MAG: hypothetical protein JWO03_1700 [Bacteroidetes bacterium]|nr:hypothetical protein [Bacteroidota bacterium]
MDIDQITQIVGHISKDEGLWLSQVSADCQVLEIGCFRGKSTAYIASTANFVVCCDGFCGQKILRTDQKPVDFTEVKRDFEKNLKALGLYDRIKLYPKISELAFEEISVNHGKSFQVAFIDGGHDEASVLADLKYSDLILNGGIIAFHDYHDIRYPDVKKTVDRWSLNNSSRIKKFSSIGTIQAFHLH